MIKSRKLFFTLLGLILLSCLIFCLIQFNINTNIKILNSDWWIKHHRYKKNHETAYIIIESDHKITFKEYLLDQKVPTEIYIDQNTNFILSLHSNGTMPFKWYITNELKENSLLYTREEYMDPINYFETLLLILNPKKGENWQRLNYYFKNIRGNEVIYLENSHFGNEPKEKYPVLHRGVTATSEYQIKNLIF